MAEDNEIVEGIKEVKHIFQNSYECGKAGNRHTIKYFTKEELLEQLKWLKECDLIDELI